MSEVKPLICGFCSSNLFEMGDKNKEKKKKYSCSHFSRLMWTFRTHMFYVITKFCFLFHLFKCSQQKEITLQLAIHNSLKVILSPCPSLEMQQKHVHSVDILHIFFILTGCSPLKSSSLKCIFFNGNQQMYFCR